MTTKGSPKIRIDWDVIEKKFPTINRKKDRGPVIQGLGVDLNACIEHNQLPTGDVPLYYNELQISEVSGRINCVFDALDAEIRASGISASAQGGSVGASGRASVQSSE